SASSPDARLVRQRMGHIEHVGGLEVVLLAGSICALLARQFNRPLRAQRRAARRRARAKSRESAALSPPGPSVLGSGADPRPCEDVRATAGLALWPSVAQGAAAPVAHAAARTVGERRRLGVHPRHRGVRLAARCSWSAVRALERQELPADAETWVVCS